MPSELQVPSACLSCDRAWLASALEQNARCPFCGGPAAVIPGESYQAEDAALFQRIERVLHNRRLSRLTSQGLWTILSNVSERGRRPNFLLLPVVDAVPGLQFIQDDFIRDRARLAQAAGMILVVITAHLHALESQGASATG
jgi:hypothetical protein